MEKRRELELLNSGGTYGDHKRPMKEVDFFSAAAQTVRELDDHSDDQDRRVGSSSRVNVCIDFKSDDYLFFDFIYFIGIYLFRK